MSKKIIPTKLSGFTPIIDMIIPEVGLTGAAVFGVVWRHCQMRDRVCKASLQTMADKIGVSRATILRKLSELSELGFIEDLTPNLKHKPHVYRDTGKLGLDISIGISLGNTRSDEEYHGETQEYHSETVGVSQSELSKPIEDTNKDTNITNQSTSEEPPQKKKRGRPSKPKESCPKEFFDALCILCKIDISVIDDITGERVRKVGLKLTKAGNTVEDLRGFYRWWYSRDWRGKQGQAPEPEHISKAWGSFKDIGKNFGNPQHPNGNGGSDNGNGQVTQEDYETARAILAAQR